MEDLVAVEPRRRPGGIANVVAGDSTIAGPAISLPALDVVELVDVGVSASRRPCHQTSRVALVGGAPSASSASGSAGFSTSTEPSTIAWVIR